MGSPMSVRQLSLVVELDTHGMLHRVVPGTRNRRYIALLDLRSVPCSVFLQGHCQCNMGIDQSARWNCLGRNVTPNNRRQQRQVADRPPHQTADQNSLP